MTSAQFHTWMATPSAMNAESIKQLREVVARYPYFSIAQQMLAKNLKQENYIDQLDQQHLAAICTPNRKVFYNYMHDLKFEVAAETSEETAQKTSAEKEDRTPVKIVANTVSEVDKAIPKKENIALSFPDDLIPEPVIYQLVTADLPDIQQKETEVISEQIEKEQAEPTELNFSQWLEYTQSGKAKKQQEKPVKLKPNQGNKLKNDLQLIDSFLTERPKKRAEFFDPKKVADKSMEQDFTVISETLANIYAQQEKYELAIQAYEALSLKYPEKSVYFAARLKEIDEKQNRLYND